MRPVWLPLLHHLGALANTSSPVTQVGLMSFPRSMQCGQGYACGTDIQRIMRRSAHCTLDCTVIRKMTTMVDEGEIAGKQDTYV
ncbi:hypothetical protein DFH27DRAFT_334245 [Peziza echinospora]|nr:hypothetical protein DFH27DRAFT_334245 [Peziza echinospora]